MNFYEKVEARARSLKNEAIKEMKKIPLEQYVNYYKTAEVLVDFFSQEGHRHPHPSYTLEQYAISLGTPFSEHHLFELAAEMSYLIAENESLLEEHKNEKNKKMISEREQFKSSLYRMNHEQRDLDNQDNGCDFQISLDEDELNIIKLEKIEESLPQEFSAIQQDWNVSFDRNSEEEYDLDLFIKKHIFVALLIREQQFFLRLSVWEDHNQILITNKKWVLNTDYASIYSSSKELWGYTFFTKNYVFLDPNDLGELILKKITTKKIKNIDTLEYI